MGGQELGRRATQQAAWDIILAGLGARNSVLAAAFSALPLLAGMAMIGTHSCAGRTEECSQANTIHYRHGRPNAVPVAASGVSPGIRRRHAGAGATAGRPTNR